MKKKIAKFYFLQRITTAIWQEEDDLKFSDCTENTSLSAIKRN